MEVDGKIHVERSARDGDRDIALRSLGLRVLHFTNAEIKSSWTTSSLASRLFPCPVEALPASGEGRVG